MKNGKLTHFYSIEAINCPVLAGALFGKAPNGHKGPS